MVDTERYVAGALGGQAGRQAAWFASSSLRTSKDNTGVRNLLAELREHDDHPQLPPPRHHCCLRRQPLAPCTFIIEHYRHYVRARLVGLVRPELQLCWAFGAVPNTNQTKPSVSSVWCLFSTTQVEQLQPLRGTHPYTYGNDIPRCAKCWHTHSPHPGSWEGCRYPTHLCSGCGFWCCNFDFGVCCVRLAVHIASSRRCVPRTPVSLEKLSGRTIAKAGGESRGARAP